MILAGEGVLLPMPDSRFHGHYSGVVQEVLFVAGVWDGLMSKSILRLFLSEDVVAFSAGSAVAILS